MGYGAVGFFFGLCLLFWRSQGVGRIFVSEARRRALEKKPLWDIREWEVRALEGGGVFLAWTIILVGINLASSLPSDAMPEGCPEDSQRCARLSSAASFRMSRETPLELRLSEKGCMDAAFTWATTDAAVNTTVHAGTMHTTFVSSIFGFIDDVWVRCTPTGNGTVDVTVHSQSRVGKSDLGINPRRVSSAADFFRRWHMELETALNSGGTKNEQESTS